MKRFLFFTVGLVLSGPLGCKDDAAPVIPLPDGGRSDGGAGNANLDGQGTADGSAATTDAALRPGEGTMGGAGGGSGLFDAGGETLNGGSTGDGGAVGPGAGGAGGHAGGHVQGGEFGSGGEGDLRGMAGGLGMGGESGEMGGEGGEGGAEPMQIDLGLSPVECRQDEECGAGYCRPVPNVEGAASYCVTPVMRPILPCENPDDEPPEGTCCQDRHCRDGDIRGHCTVNSAGICGDAPAEELNSCRFDACYRAADCAGDEICIPAGFRGDLFNRCVRAECRISGECRDRPGGQCRILSTGTNCTGEPLFVCTYPEDPCRTDRDCGEGFRCVVGEAGIACLEATPDPE